MKTRMERVVSSIMFFVSPFHLYPLSMSVIIIHTLLLNKRRRFLECLIWTKIIWIDFWFKSNWMNLIQKKMINEKRRDKKIGPKVQAQKWMMVSTTIKESNWLIYIYYTYVYYIYIYMLLLLYDLNVN